MKDLLRLALVPLAAFGLFALAAGLRRESSDDTPGAVVEEFLRHVEREQYEKAAPLLAADLGQGTTPDVLRAWDREVRVGLGDVRRVHGETEWISGDRAEASGVLEAERRERRLRFGLRREGGRWAIDRLDEFWSDVEASARVSEKWRERSRPLRARRPASR